jgi:hypothetical protein
MFATSLSVPRELAEAVEALRSILSSLLKRQQKLITVKRDQLLVAQKHLDFV